jgi:hypothetical protein
LMGWLLFQPGVMVTSVPWQLASSERAAARRPETPPGSTRRGYEADELGVNGAEPTNGIGGTTERPTAGLRRP